MTLGKHVNKDRGLNLEMPYLSPLLNVCFTVGNFSWKDARVLIAYACQRRTNTSSTKF
jgi:uncharacterized protein with ParB-like and HNH nuclease domain